MEKPPISRTLLSSPRNGRRFNPDHPPKRYRLSVIIPHNNCPDALISSATRTGNPYRPQPRETVAIRSGKARAEGQRRAAPSPSHRLVSRARARAMARSAESLPHTPSPRPVHGRWREAPSPHPHSFLYIPDHEPETQEGPRGIPSRVSRSCSALPSSEDHARRNPPGPSHGSRRLVQPTSA